MFPRWHQQGAEEVSPSRSKSTTERSSQSSRKSANYANIDRMVQAKVLYILDTHEPGDVFPLDIGSDYPEASSAPEGDVNMYEFLQNRLGLLWKIDTSLIAANIHSSILML